MNSGNTQLFLLLVIPERSVVAGYSLREYFEEGII